MRTIQGNGTKEFLTAEYYANPYPTYRKLLASTPIFWSEKARAWIVSPFKEVEKGLHQEVFTQKQRMLLASSHFNSEELKKMQYILENLSNWVVFQDPPEHTRLRRLINKSFTPKSISTLAPKIEAIVSQLLDEAMKKETFNLVDQFSSRLPALVICELLGIPGAMEWDMKRWSNGIAGFTASARITHEQAAHAEAVAREAEEYLMGFFEQVRRTPNDGLLSRIVNSQHIEDRLTDKEIVGLTIQLFFAGFETTEGLIGNMVITLINHPDQMAILRSEPEIMDAAVEETLRYASSILKQSRVASEDIELLGQTVNAGDYVHFMIGAANHDPARFSNPEVFDIKRGDTGHISFGHGIHFCIGAPLSRLEARIAMRQLLERMPNFSIMKPQPTFPELLAVRKPTQLWVTNG